MRHLFWKESAHRLTIDSSIERDGTFRPGGLLRRKADCDGGSDQSILQILSGGSGTVHW